MHASLRTWTWVTMASIVLMAGCIPSLYPIYTDQDVVVRPGLIGHWANEDKTQTWVFTEREGSAYDLAFTDKEGRTGSFIAHLTEIEGVLVMDLFPDLIGQQRAGFYNLHLPPTHTFYRVDLGGSRMILSFVNPQWLLRYHDEHPDALAHVQRDDNSIVLTADTAALRSFLAKHFDTEGAFSPFVLHRASE